MRGEVCGLSGGGRQGIAEFSRLLPQVGQLAIGDLLLVGFSPDILIRGLEFEQVIDGARDLVRGGDLGLHRAELGALAAIERAESTLTADDTGGRLAKSLARAVVGLQGVIAQNLAT